MFSYRTSPEIDEGLYLRRGTSYGLTSCVFRVMPRDLIVLLIINRERHYTSRSREATERMPVAAAAAAYGGCCITVFVGRSHIFRYPIDRCSLKEEAGIFILSDLPERFFVQLHEKLKNILEKFRSIGFSYSSLFSSTYREIFSRYF